MSFSLKKVIEWTGAVVLQGDFFDIELDGIGTDTRKKLNNKIFISLKGDVFDGHDFLVEAHAAGAVALLVHDWPEKANLYMKDLSIPILKVPDTLIALQNMATGYRKNMKAFVLGITGSNGKTTTKEFAAAILGPYKQVHWSQGSFNNHWGVPFTLLDLKPTHDVAVVEMGMNHSGEITQLVNIALPDVVVCTTVGKAHIENFGSIDGIAAAKEEIYRAAPPSVIKIFNLDNPWTLKMYEKAKHPAENSKMITFSALDLSADIFLQIKDITIDCLNIQGVIGGVSGQVSVPVFGEQNLNNILSASALALSVGLSPEQIWKALPLCRTNWGRNQKVHLKSGARVIFDAYNANPDSMLALIRNLKLIKTTGHKVAILGQMLELGEYSREAHKQLGQWIGSSEMQAVYFIGEDFESFRGGLESVNYKGYFWGERQFQSDMAISAKQRLMNPNDFAIIKGSRGMKLEVFLSHLEPVQFVEKGK